MSTVSVDSGYKRLVILLAHMFYSGHCPPAWWIDAAEGPKKEAQAEETLEDKRAAQLAREAKRKAQVRLPAAICFLAVKAVPHPQP